MAGILICRQCGYENPDGGTICVHCKANLPVSKPEADAEAGSKDARTPSGKIAFIDQDIVEKEIKLARQHLGNNDFELANLFAKNAAGLELLTDPGAKGDRAQQIVELRKKSETGGMTVERKCPACGGTGKLVMDAQSLNGKTTKINVAGQSCVRCGGSGQVLKPSTMDERRYKIGRALNRYTALQQGRKMVSVLGAWIPASLDGALSVKQMVVLKRAVAMPCADCMGLGRTDCKKCNGQGEVKCTYQGCLHGKTEVTEESKFSRETKKKFVNCRNCHGTGFVACADCRGKGSIVCKKCNGSGERSQCQKCSGQGSAACRRCQGVGTLKDATCTECRGDGVVECSACNGDGRKK
jgi:hypothetical protein